MYSWWYITNNKAKLVYFAQAALPVLALLIHDIPLRNIVEPLSKVRHYRSNRTHRECIS